MTPTASAQSSPSSQSSGTGAATVQPIGVTLTERAAKRIAQIAAGEGTSTALRISVEGGGCSGFQYKYDLTQARAADDVVLERCGAQVLIDPVSLEYMAGSEIDFVDDLMGAMFKITNPKAVAACGCGTSFSL
jgi:iron-sulfur cluster assembly accessory protein